jgi:3-dehydroquinate synthase
LSQIDSSIGGKTAIDFNGVKNSVGHSGSRIWCWQIQIHWTTLTPRHYHNGLAEAVKEGLIKDEKLFHLLNRMTGMITSKRSSADAQRSSGML